MGKKTIILLCVLTLASLTFLYLSYNKQPPSTITPGVASVADKSGNYLITYKKEYGPPTVQTYTLNPNQSLVAWLTEKDKSVKNDPLCTNCFTLHSQTSYTTNKGEQLIIRETTSHPAGRSISGFFTTSHDVVVKISYLCGAPETPCSPEKTNQLKEISNTLQVSRK